METLINQRQAASKLSKGTSSEVIYSLFLDELQNLQSSGDLLDFGSGTGNLTNQLQSLNAFKSISAIDLFPPPTDLDLEINWMTGDLNEITGFSDESFDIIVSAEVIEHLENPRAVVREWYRLLRPSGKLVFSTPNNESWRSILSLLFQGHFVAFGDTCYPAHITALLRKDIERILKETGFSAPIFKFTDYGGLPKLPKVSWQRVSGNLLKGVRYSDNLLIISQKICQL